MRRSVRKPLLGREAPLRNFDGKFPVILQLVIGHREGDVAAGIGIREPDTPITTNLSRFVPSLS